MIPLTALKFIDTLGSKLVANGGNGIAELTKHNSDSLIEVSKATRVEPIVLVDQTVEHLPYMTDVLQSVTSIIAGYYLQAAALTVNVGKVDALRLLDRLNPSRTPDWGLESLLLQSNSYQLQLPVVGTPVGLEAYGLEASETDSNIKEIRENTNLSVGKLIQVTINSEGETATFPVNVRLIASTITPTLINAILTEGERDDSLLERFHLLRAGQIEFVRDFIFCQDLINARKKLLLSDKKGQFAEILNRRRTNNVSTFLNGKTSLATASNIVVISDATRKSIEREHGFKFSSAAVRERIFKDTYIMLLVVVDADHEYVTIYSRSIALPTELTVRQIKASNKGTGPDITEILKAYQLGNAPSY